MTNNSTCADALHLATLQLQNISDSASLDAEVLLAHVLNVSRTQLLTWPNKFIAKNEYEKYIALITRRRQGEPIAYLLQQKEFWSLNLKVSPATLIPRPETEILVELTLGKLAEDDSISLADLGTGSGAIALALAHERPQWHILAIDNSAQALEVARYNQQQLQINNVRFLQGSWCEPLPPSKLHALVSNPPYIDISDPHLQQGDVRFEPPTALVAANHGLKAIQTIINQATQHLLPNGWLLIEHGYNQGSSVRDLFIKAGFQAVTTHNDYAGIPRVTCGQI